MTEETFANGKPKSAFHLAKENGGVAGLCAYRVRSGAARLQALLDESKDWTETSEETDTYRARVTSALASLEEAEEAIGSLSKEWRPKNKRRSQALSEGQSITFKGTVEATSLRCAMGLAEDAVGKVASVLEHSIITADFGAGVLACKASLFVGGETASAEPVDVETLETVEPKQKSISFDSKTKKELDSIAKEAGIPRYSKLNRAELVKVLSENSVHA